MRGSDGPHGTNGGTSGAARGGWRRFKAGEPGRRFKDLYRWRRERAGGALWGLVITLVGTGLLIAGIALMVVPGPGLLVFFFGLGLIGTQSLLVARFMDWAEERARGLLRRFGRDRRG